MTATRLLLPSTGGNIYQVDTATVPYCELTSFHPELLLREFIILAHGERFGKLRFYKK